MKLSVPRDKKRILASLLILTTFSFLITLLSGCQTAPNDGKIISKELVKVPGQNPKINIYKIFYYSEGTKAEALLTVPNYSGKFPLVVHLHGGRALGDKSISHFDESVYTVDGVSKGSRLVITLYPEYRGYLESDGNPQGLAGSTLDAQNAIKAATSMIGDKLKSDSIYLIGTSFGGGIALRLASERHDVKAVVALSPYVGADEIVRWFDEHPTYTSTYYRTHIEDYKNEMTKNNGTLLDRIPDIQAPVLFLQGSGDPNVIWQTVEQLANDMKKANKTVKLIIYPNGNHGLTDQYQYQRNQEIYQWFTQYGIPKSWNI